MNQNISRPLILFDGVCNLCNGFVFFIIARDPKKVFQFASLQSDAAKVLLASFHISTSKMNTVMLIEDGTVFQKSTAALKILSQLKGWKWSSVFMIVPRVLRDIVYDLVARYRYRIFGRTEACMVPSRELQERFLE